MTEARLVEFYGGPIDGQRWHIPVEADEVRIPVRTPIKYFDTATFPPPPPKVHIYRKTEFIRHTEVGVVTRFDFQTTTKG